MMKRILMLALLLSCGCTARRQTNSTQSFLELWDVGNVFVQPKQTLIFNLRSDGRIVSRVDDSGKPGLDLTLTQVPKTRIMVGRIDPREAASILYQIKKTGFLKADRYSGLNFPDGPSIRLVFRYGNASNEIQHVAVNDTKYHNHMNTPELDAFKSMWDKIASALRTIHNEKWRPVTAEDRVTTEIPWKRENPK